MYEEQLRVTAVKVSILQQGIIISTSTLLITDKKIDEVLQPRTTKHEMCLMLKKAFFRTLGTQKIFLHLKSEFSDTTNFLFKVKCSKVLQISVDF